jgi:hypothetical protein
VPLLVVEAVVALDLILCLARTEVSLDAEIDGLLLNRNLFLDVSLDSCNGLCVVLKAYGFL